MKKMLFLLALTAFLPLFAACPKGFSIKAELPADKKVFTPGTAIPVKLIPKAPEGYSLHAWRYFAYVNCLPEKFAEKTNIKIHVNRQGAQWNSVPLQKWNWKRQKLNDTLRTTAAWPEGDYKVTIHVLFRKTDKPDVKTDVYGGTEIIFTLDK